MSSSNNKKSKKILQRLEKHGENVYDGITPAAPNTIVDTYRALQNLEVQDANSKYYRNNIELSKMLMSIDNKYYGVDDESAEKLIDYIEEQDFDVLPELKEELREKKRAFSENTRKIADLTMDEYMSPLDYKRAVLYRVSEMKIFERKLEYVGLIIRTIEDFKNDIETEYKNETEYSDFSLLFTNNNQSNSGAGRLL